MEQKFNIGQRVKCIVDMGDGLAVGTLGTVTELPSNAFSSAIFAAIVDFDCKGGEDWPMVHGEIEAL